MRVGRDARALEGIQDAARRWETPRRGGKMRRVLTWPWTLKKSNRGFDALLDRSEGTGIARRAWMQQWDSSAAETGVLFPDVAAGATATKPKGAAHVSNLTIAELVRLMLAAACLSLLCLFALCSRISSGSRGSGRNLWWSADVSGPSPNALLARELAWSEAMAAMQHQRGGEAAGNAALGMMGRHWDERLASMGGVDSYVEVMRPGHGVRLAVALNASMWEDMGVVYNDPKRPLGRYARGGSPGVSYTAEELEGSDLKEMEAPGALTPRKQKSSLPASIASSGGLVLDMNGAVARCPTGHIRVMIAVVSRCCGSLAFTNRAAIRKTWMMGINSKYADYLDARFFIAQPPNPKQYAESYNALRAEVKLYNDIVVLPGKEDYLELPRKSLQVLQYAVESPCNYTHVLKIDDDCYLRGDNLMKMIGEGHKRENGLPSEVPWMHEMYAGQLQGAWEGDWMGFYPDRNPKSKWYLTEEELPDDVAPIGLTYLLGWGYVMSRDMAEHAVERAANYTASPEGRPSWWAMLPWEDTVVGALLADRVEWHNHWGFKSAWNACSNDTIVKHLDIDAPEYQYRLHHDEVSGNWSNSTVPCSTGEGDFEINDYNGWRVWRDSLPDVAWTEV